MFAVLSTFALCAAQTTSYPTLVTQRGHVVDSGATITALQGVASNSNGGFSVVMDISSWPTRSVIWGTFGDTAPTVLLRSDDLFPPRSGSRLTFAPVHALGNDKIVFHLSGLDPVGRCRGGFVWQGTERLQCVGDAGPVRRSIVTKLARAAVPSAGDAAYALGISIGKDSQIAFYRGDDPEPVLATGDSVVGINSPLDRLSYPLVSSRGSHFGCSSSLVGPEPALALINGAPVMNQGARIQNGTPVDPSLGPESPKWFRLYQAIKTENGDVWIAGSDDGPDETNGILMKNGRVVLREGDVIDGFELVFTPFNLVPAPDGHALAVWSGRRRGASPETLFIRRGRVVAYAGQPMDLNGDGTPDPGAAIVGLDTGAAIDEDGTVHAVVSATTPGTGSAEPTLVRIATTFGDTICASEPNSTGGPSTLEGLGTQLIQRGNLNLVATDLPPRALVVALASRHSTILPMANGAASALCLGGLIGRFGHAPVVSSYSGEAICPVNLAELPTANGSTSARPGETLYFQLWHRDRGPNGATGAGFGPAIAIRPR